LFFGDRGQDQNYNSQSRDSPAIYNPTHFSTSNTLEAAAHPHLEPTYFVSAVPPVYVA